MSSVIPESSPHNFDTAASSFQGRYALRDLDVNIGNRPLLRRLQHALRQFRQITLSDARWEAMPPRLIRASHSPETRVRTSHHGSVRIRTTVVS